MIFAFSVPMLRPFYVLFLGVFMAVAISQSTAQVVRVPLFEESVILSHGFYQKTNEGLQSVKEYKSGDSSFYIVIHLEPVAYHRSVQFVWYFVNAKGEEEFIDSVQVDFPGEVGAYTGSLTRSGLFWEAGSYKVEVDVIDSGKAFNKERASYDFEVIAEPVPGGFFINPLDSQSMGRHVWNTEFEKMNLLLVVDSLGIEGKSELETYWFFLMPEEEPLSIHQSFFDLSQLNDNPQRSYFLNIPYTSRGGWPQGVLLVEVWIDGKWVRFFEIEVQ